MTLAFPKDLILGGGPWAMSLVFNVNYISTSGSSVGYDRFKVKETAASETSDLNLTVVSRNGERLYFDVVSEDNIPVDRDPMYVKELPTSVTAEDKFTLTDVYGNKWGFGVVPESYNEE